MLLRESEIYNYRFLSRYELKLRISVPEGSFQDAEFEGNITNCAFLKLR